MSMRFVWLVVLLGWTLFAGYDAQLTIEKKVDERVRIAVLDGSLPSEISKKIASIFIADLKISGHFIPDETYRVGTYAGTMIDPALRGNDYVLIYAFSRETDDAMLQVKVLDAANSKRILERRYRVKNVAKYPFLVHKAVTEINAHLRFSPIDWINRYVVFARYTGRKQSEIVLADFTFHFTKTIIRGGLNLFPHWGDPKQQTIYYTAYVQGRPTLFRLNIYTGERTQITSSAGMLACSDVSPDGSTLLLTMAPNGQSDIYAYTIATAQAKRLTRFSGIDVNGVYADDGKSLVFVSNRLGYPNVFKKDLATGVTQQIVFRGKNNNSVDAYGDTVVYSAREGQGVFNLYTAHTDGSPGRQLTSTGVNQFPRFSPDGDTILYIKRSYEGNAVGYLGLKTDQALLFPLGERKIQSLDW
jgi:TolB protein